MVTLMRYEYALLTIANSWGVNIPRQVGNSEEGNTERSHCWQGSRGGGGGIIGVEEAGVGAGVVPGG